MTSAHIVAVVAIVFGTLYGIFDLLAKSKSKNKNTEELEAVKKQLEDELTDVKQRLAVLEKIVTDEKYNLRSEIDALDKVS